MQMSLILFMSLFKNKIVFKLYISENYKFSKNK